VLRLSGDVEGKLKLWNGETGHDVAQLPGPVRKLSMTHDGKRALAADTKSVYWVDVEHGKVVKVADGMTKVQMLTIDPTERRAAIAGNDSDVILVDVATGAVERRRGHTDALYGALFDSRGERLITPSDDGTIRVWDLDTGDSRVLRGHDDDVYAAAVTPDGRTVVSASLDGSARLWHVGDRKTVVVGQLGDVRNMSPLGGDRVRVVSQSDPVRVTDVDLRARTASIRYAADSKVADSDISADGSTVIVPVRPGHIAVWRDGEAKEMDFPDTAIMARMSGDGRRAVSLEAGGEVKLFDDDHVTVLRDKSTTTSIAMRKDGQRVALVGPEAIEVLDASTGASIAQLPRAAHSISSGKLGIEFMADGRNIVVQDLTGLRLWNVESGSIVSLERSMYGHPKVAQSPDGAMIAVGVEDRSVRLWDVRTGKERRTLRGHRDLVNSIAFSPDGKRLATGSYDKSVRVWDVQTGDGRVLSGHVGPVWTVAWVGPDQVASGSSDGTVRLWTLPVTPPPRADEIADQLRKETSAMIDDRQRPTTPD
jgi:WD40 repeat protein